MAKEDVTSADSEWKKIQQNTFTRWCNEHLKAVDLYVYNLETDFRDGLKLIALLQVLTHKKIGRYSKRPLFKSQKMENVAISLRFIEDQTIQLVNIDASDIVKGNLKMILGLVWALILKYSVSTPLYDDKGDLTPKQKLLAWVNEKIPDFSIKNFSTDWNNGRAVCALIDACAPGLCPAWEESNETLENVQKAMKLAEDWLGVPQVVIPEDIVNPKIDEFSVMTYMSYFVKAKVKAGAPLAN
ncbi:filamin-A-like [Anneissia japonica]|uniref:filamin-A-like n=1 Tax=Anneissia japonica TaxID=1529436 RepID=UPI001425B6E6|nr:filamin-A-like [Anneissia japonica]